MLFLLTGCGEVEQQVKHCEMSTKDVVSGYELQSDYTIYYTGDYVDKVETVETVTSDSSEILDYMEEYLSTTYDSMNNAYGGYVYDVTKEDNKIVSKVEINYNKMDLEQFVTDQPALKNYVKDGKMLLDGVVSIYESNGSTCE